ncbi:MAG: transposase [Patescibacteria group bacterium UBA2163]
MDFYHVLNRGVDKRKTFLDSGDYARFIHDMWEFNEVNNAPHNLERRMLKQNLEMGDVRRHPLVRVHFFCLMPNHYHLLVSPIDDDPENLSSFMKKLGGGYAKYFNEKYERSGALWQGKYKKVLVERDAHFLYLPYYIHFNALDLEYPDWREQRIAYPKHAEDYLGTYRWSSHLDYLGEKNFPSVTDREFFLDFFGGSAGYAKKIRSMLRDLSLEEIDGVVLE